MGDLRAGTMVKVDGRGPWPISVDNGNSVFVPLLPEHMARWDHHPRAGQWGGPARFDRWVEKTRIEVVDGSCGHEMGPERGGLCSGCLVQVEQGGEYTL